jgi:hypothetical protein
MPRRGRACQQGYDPLGVHPGPPVTLPPRLVNVLAQAGDRTLRICDMHAEASIVIAIASAIGARRVAYTGILRSHAEATKAALRALPLRSAEFILMPEAADQNNRSISSLRFLDVPRLQETMGDCDVLVAGMHASTPDQRQALLADALLLRTLVRGAE